MFAGGTGISPCRSFWLERTKHSHKVENWLFFSTATRRDFYYQQELTELMVTGKLQLRVVFPGKIFGLFLGLIRREVTGNLYQQMHSALLMKFSRRKLDNFSGNFCGI